MDKLPLITWQGQLKCFLMAVTPLNLIIVVRVIDWGASGKLLKVRNTCDVEDAVDLFALLLCIFPALIFGAIVFRGIAKRDDAYQIRREFRATGILYMAALAWFFLGKIE